MARTAQQVVDQVRLHTNDVDADGRTDAAILLYISDAINFLLHRRPDLFIGKFSQTWDSVSASTELPFDGKYFQAVVMYTVGRCEMSDDEYAVNGRAELAAKFSESLLT